MSAILHRYYRNASQRAIGFASRLIPSRLIPSRLIPSRLIPSSLIGLSLMAFGCETAVDAVIETELPFTMYGLFNPLSDTQAVRIFPIDGVLERTSNGGLGAVVTSTNLDTGEQRIWADSIIAFPRADIGHVYWSAFTVGYEERYRLTVRREDGAQSEVETLTPPLSTTEIRPGDITNFELPIPVLFRDAPNLIDITVTYRTSVGTYPVNYGVDQLAQTNGRLVVINFRDDTRPILLNAFLSGMKDVKLAAIELSAVVTNAEWTPPDGRFDPDFLVEPGTFSNVTNGFGFVGSGYRVTIEWTPSDQFLRIAGFSVS